MITNATTTVYVRVDLASRRPIAVSDEVLADRPGKPVFTVTANSPRLDYYVVEEDVTNQYGVSVRIATAGEQTAADTAVADRVATSLAKQKYSKSFVIKDLYDEAFIRRFRTEHFFTTTETIAAAGYTGVDTAAATAKAQAVAVMDTYNEWRWNNTATAIANMQAAPDLSVETDEFKANLEDELDAFLTAAGYDINVYSR